MIAASPASLAECLQAYFRFRPGLAPGTRREMERSVRQFEQFCGKTVRVTQLCDDLLAGWISHLADKAAASTVNTKRAHLLAVWRFSRRKHYCTEAPEDVPRLQEPEPVPEAWTVAEVEQLLACARRLPGCVGKHPARCWWPALTLAIYWTGSRPGAILRCHPRDFRPESQSLIVRQTKNRRDKLYRLHPQAVEWISKIHDPQAALLFDWPLSPKRLWKHFRRIVIASGVSVGCGGRQLFYRLRRTTLSYCAAADIGIAQRQADHSTPALTRRCYIDPRIAGERSAADVLPTPHIADSRQLRLF